eukprot:SAG31_NODE_8483_length_1442_cov_21.843634_1_plen_139_part_00
MRSWPVVAVAACAANLEQNQPTVFAELYEKDYSMQGVDVRSDGSVWGFDKVWSEPRQQQSGLTAHAGSICLAITGDSSTAAVDVLLQYVKTIWTQPYIREMPQAFLDLMASDLGGEPATDYRGHVRHELKPMLGRIKV